jgi:hypothetical protein
VAGQSDQIKETHVNQKRAVRSDWESQLLHEVKVNGSILRKGMLLSVNRRPGLPGGKWVFLHAEHLGDILQLTVEGPISREARRRWIRPEDIKTIHRKARR